MSSKVSELLKEEDEETKAEASSSLSSTATSAVAEQIDLKELVKRRVRRVFKNRNIGKKTLTYLLGAIAIGYMTTTTLGFSLASTGAFFAGFLGGSVFKDEKYASASLSGALLGGGTMLITSFMNVLFGLGIPMLVGAGIGATAALLGVFMGASIRHGFAEDDEEEDEEEDNSTLFG